MSTYAILPVKQYKEAKQRLHSEISRYLHQQLVPAMVQDVMKEISQAKTLAGCVLVTAEKEVQAAGRKYGFLTVHEPTLLGHSGAAKLGIQTAITTGANRVFLLSGDCPLITATDIDELLTQMTTDVTIVSDRQSTGTNALILQPPRAIEPAFGADSCQRHLHLARQAKRSVSIIQNHNTLAADVDYKADLQFVQQQLTKRLNSQAKATHLALVHSSS